MRLLRQLCAMFLLSLVFALPALAGETNTPPEEPPGDIHTPGRMSTPVKVSLRTTLALAVQNIWIIVP